GFSFTQWDAKMTVRGLISVAVHRPMKPFCRSTTIWPMPLTFCVSMAWVGVKLSLITTAEAGVASAAKPARAVAPRNALRTRAKWRRLLLVMKVPCRSGTKPLIACDASKVECGSGAALQVNFKKSVSKLSGLGQILKDSNLEFTIC